MPNYILHELEMEGPADAIVKVKEQYTTHLPVQPYVNGSGHEVYETTRGDYAYYAENLDRTHYRSTDRREPTAGRPPKEYKQVMTEAQTVFPDFDKVIERPAILDHTDTLPGYLIDIAYLKAGVEGDRGNVFYDAEAVRADLEALVPDSEDGKDVESFVAAIKETGYATSYKWNVANWATKWNALECKGGEGVHTWLTAWEHCKPIILAMSKNHPLVTFKVKHADTDDEAGICGHLDVCGGEILRDTREGPEFWIQLCDGRYEQ